MGGCFFFLLELHCILLRRYPLGLLDPELLFFFFVGTYVIAMDPGPQCKMPNPRAWRARGSYIEPWSDVIPHSVAREATE